MNLSIRNFFKQFYRQIFTSKSQNKNKLNTVDIEPVTFINTKKDKLINRLYVWGNSGTGALGINDLKFKTN